MKTKVKITSNYVQGLFKEGDTGYIDGYVQAADTRPYAVVVCNGMLDMVPLYCLKVISETNKP